MAHSNIKSSFIQMKLSLFFKVTNLQKKWKNFRNYLSDILKSNKDIGVPYSKKCMEFHKLPSEIIEVDSATGKTIEVEKYANCHAIIRVKPNYITPRKTDKNIDKVAEFNKFREEMGADLHKNSVINQ